MRLFFSPWSLDLLPPSSPDCVSTHAVPLFWDLLEPIHSSSLEMQQCTRPSSENLHCFPEAFGGRQGPLCFQDEQQAC